MRQPEVNTSVEHLCYLGLGSNQTNKLGTPQQHLMAAITTMQNHTDIQDVRVSSLYASKPMGPQDQPDFVNAVVEIRTCLSPAALLMFCQTLEQQAGRVRLRRWGERSLDVDILLYGEQSIDEPNLTIPHTGLTERNFVLIPLLELNAAVTVDGQPLNQLPASQDWRGLQRLIAFSI